MPAPGDTPNYTSTIPWYSASNPWPIYSQLTLSAADIMPDTFNLVNFKPAGPGTPLKFESSFLHVSTGNALWSIEYSDNNGWRIYDVFGNNLYTLNTMVSAIPNVRSIPNKTAGSAQGWVQNSGTNVNSLYMQPVYTSRTLMEGRRIAGGTG